LWNWLDFVIVVGGCVDQWLLPCINILATLLEFQAPSTGRVGQLMMVLRTFRLLRILRLVRLIRGCKDLLNLVMGVADAFKGMGWVLLLLSALIYIVALLNVKLIGEGLLMGGVPPEEGKEVFLSVSEAFWTFFLVMSGEFEPLDDMHRAYPWYRIHTMAFVIISSWALLSILTSVVCDRMILVSESLQQESTVENTIRLQSLFTAIAAEEVEEHSDGDGPVEEATEAKFRKFLVRPESGEELKSILGTNTLDDAIDIVLNLFDADGKGVSKTEFVNTLRLVCEDRVERSSLRVEHTLRILNHKVVELVNMNSKAQTEQMGALQELVVNMERQLVESRQFLSVVVDTLSHTLHGMNSQIKTARTSVAHEIENVSKELLRTRLNHHHAANRLQNAVRRQADNRDLSDVLSMHAKRLEKQLASLACKMQDQAGSRVGSGPSCLAEESRKQLEPTTTGAEDKSVGALTTKFLDESSSVDVSQPLETTSSSVEIWEDKLLSVLRNMDDRISSLSVTLGDRLENTFSLLSRSLQVQGECVVDSILIGLTGQDEGELSPRANLRAHFAKRSENATSRQSEGEDTSKSPSVNLRDLLSKRSEMASPTGSQRPVSDEVLVEKEARLEVPDFSLAVCGDFSASPSLHHDPVAPLLPREQQRVSDGSVGDENVRLQVGGLSPVARGPPEELHEILPVVGVDHGSETATTVDQSPCER